MVLWLLLFPSCLILHHLLSVSTVVRVYVFCLECWVTALHLGSAAQTGVLDLFRYLFTAYTHHLVLCGSWGSLLVSLDVFDRAVLPPFYIGGLKILGGLGIKVTTHVMTISLLDFFPCSSLLAACLLFLISRYHTILWETKGETAGRAEDHENRNVLITIVCFAKPFRVLRGQPSLFCLTM